MDDSRSFRCSKCQQLLAAEGFMPSQRFNGAWCRACYRAYHLARYTPSTGGTDEPRACRWCEAIYSPQARRPSWFCSAKCKNLAKNRERQDKINAMKPDRSCLHCGAIVPKSMRADAAFCSEVCNSKAHSRTRNYRRRAGVSAPLKPRKQPLVNLADIAKRDGYLCGICGGNVDMSLKHPAPGSASIDHIVPIGAGGDPLNVLNLQLSHLACNVNARSKRKRF